MLYIIIVPYVVLDTVVYVVILFVIVNSLPEADKDVIVEASTMLMETWVESMLVAVVVTVDIIVDVIVDSTKMSKYLLATP